MKEKGDMSSYRSKLMELQESNQKLQIENGALRSENLMLKSQVSFMERLLLKHSGAEQGGGLKRAAGPGLGGLGPLGGLALMGCVLAVTYLPEGGAVGSGEGVKDRILAEITTGFGLLTPKTLALYVLSIVRSALFAFVVYYFCTALYNLLVPAKADDYGNLELLDHKNK
jgi:hypothetical protein